MRCNKITGKHRMRVLCTAFLLMIIHAAVFAKKAVFCFYKDGDTTTANAASGKKITFLALGDSYTIGQSVDSSQRFPAQTAHILKHYGYAINNIDYIATTGWKTVNLQWAIEAQRIQKKYDIVTLLIGANDQYLKRDTAGYREHFTNLLIKSIAYASDNKKHVFVLSIPDYSVTPFGKEKKASARQIDQFNAINKEVSRAFGVIYTDVTGISRFDEIDSTMLAPDDMHPSGKQYEQWARALSNKILTAFQ